VNMNANKELMELTIPVFRALIAADTDNKYHRNHGSLGWALKDKRSPDWREAKDELTKAIAIRARLNITGWRLYEANRAVCNINILKGLPPGDPTQAEILADIVKDLKATKGDRYAEPMVNPDYRDPADPTRKETVDPDIKGWIHDYPQAASDVYGPLIAKAAITPTTSE